jgi:hypothetical protein
MRREEYEQRKRRLEEQFREGTALLEAAHRQQLRALELVWMTTAEEDLALGAGPVAEPAAVPSRPSPPAPSRSHRHKAGELEAGVEAALASVPEVFDRNDVCRVLGYEPDRGSLYRTLQDLVNEGTLALQRRGSGKATTQYRKTRAGSPPPGR